MRTIVFDISGRYGHFRKPYAPASPVTFPFPPPPTVMGLLGAIAGLGKEAYHEALGWRTLRIGIRPLRPVHIFRTAINLINTKETDRYFRPRGAMVRIQVPYEFLSRPAYRIYVADLPETMADRLSELLARDETVYTPILGLAQCLADVMLVADTLAQKIGTDGATCSVVPLDEETRIEYQPGRRYERVRVPAVMGPDRVVHRYRQAVMALDADPERPLPVTGTVLYKVLDETVAFF